MKVILMRDGKELRIVEVRRDQDAVRVLTEPPVEASIDSLVQPNELHKPAIAEYHTFAWKGKCRKCECGEHTIPIFEFVSIWKY